MTAPVSGCSAWAGLEDLPASTAEMHSPQDWCRYLAMATDILWAATGRRWRGPSTTESAVLRAARPRVGEAGWPYDESWGHCACFAGVTADLAPAWAVGPYQHAAPTSVRLPRPDVTAVESVLVDGVAFDGWELDGSWLSRTDGRGWAVCGERTVVAYAFGREPGEGGQAACVELAVEIGRDASGSPDRACRLPRRLTSVTRQGVTFAALDKLEFLDKGLTGLLTVDMWIKSVNPRGRAQSATVWSPDLPRARRQR